MSAILIDTNLLLLLLLGSVDRKQIGQHKRIRQYTAEQFDELETIASAASRHISTPHVLTETSNLLRLGEPRRLPGLQTWFAEYCRLIDEILVPSREAVGTQSFLRLGLADAALLETCVRNDILIVTDDLRLHGSVSQAGGRALNIWHRFTPGSR